MLLGTLGWLDVGQLSVASLPVVVVSEDREEAVVITVLEGAKLSTLPVLLLLPLFAMRSAVCSPTRLLVSPSVANSGADLLPAQAVAWLLGRDDSFFDTMWRLGRSFSEGGLRDGGDIIMTV